MKIIEGFLGLLGSQSLTNIILIVTVIAALAVGYQQIFINDVVELYAFPGVKAVQDSNGNILRYDQVIKIQNVGTRVVYMEKYIFNGVEYITHGQVLPPTYAQQDLLYWVDLPQNGINHVSLIVYYQDLDSRDWKSEIVADLVGGAWKVSSLPRILNKK